MSNLFSWESVSHYNNNCLETFGFFISGMNRQVIAVIYKDLSIFIAKQTSKHHGIEWKDISVPQFKTVGEAKHYIESRLVNKPIIVSEKMINLL